MKIHFGSSELLLSNSWYRWSIKDFFDIMIECLFTPIPCGNLFKLRQISIL